MLLQNLLKKMCQVITPVQDQTLISVWIGPFVELHEAVPSKPTRALSLLEVGAHVDAQAVTRSLTPR